ncbi:MAG: mechanosensitive ion channel [Succinivibrionaceae bacterium]|nr:mechanosensitive ion channel [Succinivibrionaceae bacterium]
MATEEVAAKAAEEAAKEPQSVEVLNSFISDPVGYITAHQDAIISVCTNLIYAVIILVIGWMVAKLFGSIANKILTKAKVEKTIANFAGQLIKYAILAFVITAALGRLGIETASFIAIIGAASFAVGMALQGSLSNFAAGVLLLIFRPIKAGEYVNVAGQEGVVQEITIFTTTLLSVDNKLIVIPNSSVGSGTIINYSREEKRRVDFNFGVAYNADIETAKKTLRQMFEADARVIKEDGITTVVSALGESAVTIHCRVWVKGSDYWDVFFDGNEKALLALKKAEVEIPYRTVTVINKK